jgi:PhoH-like ATPase
MNHFIASPKQHKMNKVFVLDTNVILHNSGCLYKFDEHDVIIPITVIEELDKLKKATIPSIAMPEVFFAHWTP